jgi:(p)ppGpp synthase/HD superfamily hydrolase
LISQAEQDWVRARERSPQTDDKEWEISVGAARTLQSWRAQTITVAASLLVPLVELEATPLNMLTHKYGHKVTDLAKRLVRWKEAVERPEEKNQQLSNVESALALRDLYRHAYKELPGIPFILLLLAYHHTRLTVDARPLTTRAASYTEKVLVPLTQMLGIWSLRREFLEESLPVLCDAYPRMSEQLGKASLYTTDGFAELLKESRDASTDKRWLQANALHIDKAEAYVTLEKHFKNLCGEQKVMPRPRILPIRPFPGIAASRIKAGEAEEDIIRRLSVRILCHTVEECYSILGIVHSLGKPIAPKLTAHFNDYNYARYNDYIACPLPNGYRALHTAIVYRPNPRSSKEVLTEFRILTPNMHRLNELGIIAAAHSRPWHYRRVSARWNLVSQAESANSSTHYYLDKRTQNLISRFKLDTRPTDGATSLDASSRERQQLYVFSPHGEVRVLPDQSTALDFAYHIHSELAHHTHDVEVNGQSVPLNYPLKNGDLIRVHYDPRFEGPDISWLSHITTARARHNLRRGLTKRARTIHAGRAIIHAELEKRLRYYRREKNFNLNITDARLDAFLQRKTEARPEQYPDLKALYVKVQKGMVAPGRLLQQLISEELATSVIRVNGLPHGYPRTRVFMCDVCRPVPGEEIEGVERKRSMTVHCRIHRKCTARAEAGATLTKLRWADGSGPGKNEFIVINLRAVNRGGLLRNVMKELYDEPEVVLHKIEASAYGDGCADIMMIVEADSWKRLVELQGRLMNVDGINHVLSFPPTPSQRLVVNTPPVKFTTTPYSALDVHDYRFYDRETLVQLLLAWLSTDPPGEWLLLHGQKRVGKTSLARHLQLRAVPQHQSNVFPIFIDMLGLPPPFDSRGVAEYIVEAVYQALAKGLAELSGIVPPRPRELERPMLWMGRALREASALLESRRLLIILDEFTTLCHHEERGEMEPSVFDNLRAAMADLRGINWLLIAQDAYYREPSKWGNASQIFARVRPLRVAHLEESWARKLITEPMERCGLKYEDKQLVGRVFELTGGNPYFISCLSLDMFEKTRARGERVITAQDLDEAVSSFVNNGERHFEQFIEKMSGVKKVLLALVVTANEEWVGVPGLIAHTQELLGRVPADALKKGLTALEDYGMLARRKAGGGQVRIPIDIFTKWLVDNLTVDGAVEEWHAARGREAEFLEKK